MTARNRELANLVAVGILTGLGFASVYIARQSVISAGSVSYALIFLGLYLVAHTVARYTVPWADPYLLPLTGLLTAIGLTEIYRLGPTDAFRQGFWIVAGVGPLLAIWGAAMLVLFETNDLGSALLYFGIFLAMLYVATGRALYVGIGLVLFAGGATVAYQTVSRVQDRVDIWLDPWQDPHG